MTGYERITRVFQGEQTDRVPTMLHCFMPAAQEAGYTMKQFRENPKYMAESYIRFAKKYGLDGILIDMDTCLEAYALGAMVDFPDDEPARLTGPAGADLETILDGIDIKKLDIDARVQNHLEAIRLIKKEVGGDIFVRGNADQGPFSLAMMLYGMEDFFMDLMDEDMEEGIMELIDRCYDVHLRFHHLVNEAGADMTSFGDSSCGPDLISRDMYLRFSAPYHKRLKKDLSDAGIDTVCHICGNLDNILEDVADIEFAGFEVDYKTDIKKAQKAFESKSVFFGPIDPSNIFYFGDPGVVAAKTAEVLDIFSGKGLVIGAGCALPVGTPEANIRAFVDTVKI